MENKPLVSIITPTYNRANTWLWKAILSVKTQTYTNWEHIIINDGSTEDTLDVVSKLYQGDNRLNLFNRAKNSEHITKEVVMCETLISIVGIIGIIVALYDVNKELNEEQRRIERHNQKIEELKRQGFFR